MKMRTLEEVQKIIGELDGGCPESNNSQPSTDEIVASLLDRPVPVSVQEQSDNSSASHNNAGLEYYLPLRSDRKIIGRWIVFFKRVVRRVLKFLFIPIVDRQNAINSHTASTIGELNNRIDALNTSNNELRVELSDAISAKNNELKVEISDGFNTKNNELRTELSDRLNTIGNEMVSLRGDLISEIGSNNDSLKNSMLYEREKFEVSVFRAIYGKDKVSGQPLQPKETNPAKNPVKLPEFNYFDFENNFRGSRDHVKEKLKYYMQYLDGRKNLIDLGCGRGELLELMRDNNIPAVGIDISQEFVDWCGFNGLEAILDDAVDHIASLEDNTVGAITGIQLVEHLSFDGMLRLCDLAFRKLESGGVLILETVNPTCLSVYSNFFYVDPTHDKPVHPLLLKYLLKEAGFQKIETVFTEHSRADKRLPLLDAQASNLAEFNDGINTLSDLLFGSQDYAIIATK